VTGHAQSLKVLFLSAEVAPFAKVGGLADVVGSLPKALRALGHDVRIAMPHYSRISADRWNLSPALDFFPVPFDGHSDPAGVLEGRTGAVPVYFVENTRLYDRESVYCYPDDAERFVFFCRAALEMCRLMGWQPDIVHCHDWHTGIVPNWLKTIYAEGFFANTASVFTIHNLAYQGIFGLRALEIAGLDEYGFIRHPQTGELNEVVDFMARGILFADVINTVSERYAQEILTPEYGERLDPILRDRKDHLFGILNGIDYEVFDPATDPGIAQPFDVDHLDRRSVNKLALQAEMGLPQTARKPLLGIIGRLADQKGFDILGDVIDHILDLGVQFALLGVGDHHYHDLFSRAARHYPDQMAVSLTFNPPLAQKIYAGTDVFLMPSRYEPCGLGQMFAMRYGSVPVVRSTGGLADTVQDFNPATGEGTGFVYEKYERWGLFGGVVRALEHYKNPPVWQQIQRQGMTRDFSWKASAPKYVDLYRRALEFKRQGAS
jgi:starch synthase